MSRAFIKEDGAQPDEDPPERPISSHPNYVTARGEALLRERERRLEAVLAELTGRQDDPERHRRKREAQRDLRYTRAKLDAAIVVDAASVPKGEARFGALVVWRRPDGSLARARIVGEDEAEEGDELLSWTSPLAQALLGLKPGDSFQAGAEGERGVIVSIEPGD